MEKNNNTRISSNIVDEISSSSAYSITHHEKTAQGKNNLNVGGTY